MDVGTRKGPGRSKGPGAGGEWRKMRNGSVARGQSRGRGKAVVRLEGDCLGPIVLAFWLYQEFRILS